jgi:hypothetical protein
MNGPLETFLVTVKANAYGRYTGEPTPAQSAQHIYETFSKQSTDTFRTIPLPVVLRRSGRNRRDLFGGLKSQSLLPDKPEAVRIERFVEKQFNTLLRYEDLGPENLDCTIFNSSGGVEAILVSRSLEEQNTIPARRRVRSTVAHEAGHGLLHGSLFKGAVRDDR